MATYRQFFIGFWDDPDIEPFSPEEKLVYLFLFTNRLATESGIYAISEKFIAERTCISINKIKTILNTLQNTYHKITYDVNIIFVHGFLKRNYRGKPELLNFSILKNVEDYPSLPCWNKFLDVYKNHCICNKIKEKLNTLPTLSQVFNDNDNDNDIDTSSLKSSSLVLSSLKTDGFEKQKYSKRSKIFIPPSFEEFEKYCQENNFGHIAGKAFKYYSEATWHDGRGDPVKNWKQKLQGVWFDEKKNPKPGNNTTIDDLYGKNS